MAVFTVEMGGGESIDIPQARRRSPRWILNVGVALAVAWTILWVALAQRLPALPSSIDLKAVTEIRASEDDSPFRLEAVDIIEEPDVLGSWAELDTFYARQGEIWRRLSGPTVDVRTSGDWKTVGVVRRGVLELPLPFYVLVASAFIAWVAGVVTYAFSDRGAAARIYFVSAVAFAITVLPAALYSSRSLALDPVFFRRLSTADHAGALFFAAGVIALVAVYPIRLTRHAWWLWVFALVAAVTGHFQIGPMWLTGFYTGNAVQFVTFIAFAVAQWRATRREPTQRAALGWILLSMFVGVIFGFTMITLPVLLGSRPAISQTTGLVSMLLVYVGISLGVLRFRLFDLDRWWFRTWSWILSGMAVVGVDLLLARVFDIKQNLALITALVIVGWAYFPIRQQLFERFGSLVGGRTRDYDPRRLIIASDDAELGASFREALTTVFAPLEIVASDVELTAPRLTAEGSWLEVPSPTGGGSLRCHFRENGARLFTREDLLRANELVSLSESVRLALEAREEGREAERTRIRRDLHDDLGASIIRIAHESRDDHTAKLAKAAMCDLRDVLTALEELPIACRDALDDVEADLRERAQADHRELVWLLRGSYDGALSARAHANLTRVLRESMTNALKHGQGDIRVEIDLEKAQLRAKITNAATGDVAVEPGTGLGNIVARVRELGGDATFERSSGRFILELHFPWSSEP